MGRGRNILHGSVQGFGSGLPTANPWAVAGTTIAGGVLGALEDEGELTAHEKMFNQLSIDQLGLTNENLRLTNRQTSRLDREERKKSAKNKIIGQQLGNLFKNLKR